LVDVARRTDRGRAAAPDPESGRERVLRAAYDLFSRNGVRAVGVDTVIEHAEVAKMTLYRHFASKDELVLAFLERRDHEGRDRGGRGGRQAGRGPIPRARRAAARPPRTLRDDVASLGRLEAKD
jgi:AcrR family transcriptional regulator